jgi:guanylate kinase
MARELKRRGVMLAVSSPSGAGKTSLCRKLLREEPDLIMSVSVTTRQPRPGERDGVDYFFVSMDEFERMEKDGEMLESAQVFGNYYGTPRAQVEDHLAGGRDMLFDVDWQGAARLHEACGDDLRRVFILPPSADELERRLVGRGQDKPEIVAKRMAGAARELSHWREYDYVIINDDLEKAGSQLRAVLQAERVRRMRQPMLADFIAEMTEKL